MGPKSPWIIGGLIVLAILLFGAGKLPSLARNLGQSMRIFKSEVEELRNDDERRGPNAAKDDAVRDGDQVVERERTREYDPRSERAVETERVQTRREDDDLRR
ncbi:Sec-independent protein translocase subunit TatA [Helcobacillus sp. ACRRO]|uniref:Sec-independent protein translocase subunit TatA n=1 Tax=Helcobacillus sp. ACRRO TaxID=2918202 RepID=UPI001EF66522|nr:Sec-independent protein translocase subunit TatA [Helcobacillus sp. ACRRO]MCG7426927.1 Sec-independent protein translocase subunit TatA [Helcobacillus sp. ACRRO]